LQFLPERPCHVVLRAQRADLGLLAMVGRVRDALDIAADLPAADLPGLPLSERRAGGRCTRHRADAYPERRLCLDALARSHRRSLEDAPRCLLWHCIPDELRACPAVRRSAAFRARCDAIGSYAGGLTRPTTE